MVPLVRIYRRKTGVFSSIFLDMTLPSDFVDSGMFLKFFSVNQNYFILKTSQSFRIYSLEPKYLIIDMQGHTPYSLSGDEKSLASGELRLNLTLTVRNQTKHSLVNSFDVLMMAKDN
jgi:hypothetical protein